MIRVRCILVEITVPVRMRPRMEIWPVKGHFLSVVAMLAPALVIFVCNPILRFFLRELAHRTGGLTDVAALNCSLGRSETETNILEPSSATLSNLLRPRSLSGLVVEENVRLLLVGTLGLDCQFGSHDCGLWLTEKCVEEEMSSWR
jgi:hypothetical protein